MDSAHQSSTHPEMDLIKQSSTEPKNSWHDFSLMSLMCIIVGVFIVVIAGAFTNYFQQNQKRRRKNCYQESDESLMPIGESGGTLMPIREYLEKVIFENYEEHERVQCKQKVLRILESIDVGTYSSFDCSAIVGLLDGHTDNMSCEENVTIEENGRIFDNRIWGQRLGVSDTKQKDPYRFSHDFLSMEPNGEVWKYRCWKKERIQQEEV